MNENDVIEAATDVITDKIGKAFQGDLGRLVSREIAQALADAGLLKFEPFDTFGL